MTVKPVNPTPFPLEHKSARRGKNNPSIFIPQIP